MAGEQDTSRTVLRIGGADRVSFLQNLVTNDLGKLASGAVYAAILTPQGKYMADFFLVEDGDAILLDIDTGLAPGIAQRLKMYKLRADVTVDETDIVVTRGLGDPPKGAMGDPRHPDLGWRAYGPEAGGDEVVDWDAIRVAHCIPQTGIELIPNETFILEVGFDRLNGVDFRKGCYVGQEVTARMRHKTELRKGLRRVGVEGVANPGDEIRVGDKSAGVLHTRAGDQAIAYLRFDRLGGDLRAGDARILPDPAA